MTRSVLSTARARWTLALAGTAGAAAVALAAAGIPAAAASTSSAAVATSFAVRPATSTGTVHLVGRVNLAKLARADARLPKSVTRVTKHEVAPLRKLPSASHGAGAASAATPSAASAKVRLTKITSSNVRGEHGFYGLNAPTNAAVNPAIGDVSPPDQGLAVGPLSGRKGPKAVVEFLNEVLNVYTPSGNTIAGAFPAYQIFNLPPSSFLSDPRAYYDPASGHWFFTMFTFAPPAYQYVAVSDSTNLLGSYTVFSINTTDAANTAGGCPCFGDYDQVGANRNGFYIATNQFSLGINNNFGNNGGFNGAVIYAFSKWELIGYADGTRTTLPTLVTYTMGVSDPFGSYHLSPSTVTQGAYAPSTEYFVETNGNLPYGPPNPPTSGKGLEVFALLHTNLLNKGMAPAMVEAPVNSESYSQPPNARQKGSKLQLQTDFNAVQEVTYTGGKLYGEFSTGFTNGRSFRSGVAWFVLKPRPLASSIKVRMAGQGYIKTSQNLLYPVIGVNAKGKGYLAMALSGGRYYPSAAYTKFNGAKGPRGKVMLAASGARPLNDFTCYPPFSTGQCRYGDYSMAQAFDGRIYMATEYVSGAPGDNLSNWGTRVWSARTP